MPPPSVLDMKATQAYRGFIEKEKNIAMNHSYDTSTFVGSNPNTMIMKKSLGGKAAPTGEVPITSQEVATGRSSVNALPQGDTARSTGRRSNRDGQSQLIPSSSARESSRATARESARDTVPDLHSSLGPSVSARLASARSGAANKTATGRSSARSGLGALDSVRTDMSTGRLESTMQSLHKEKHALMRKLLAVEEELEKETKSSALVRRK